MKKLFFVLTLTSAFFLCALVASAATTKQFYGVYCSNGKIEVDSRNPDQMKSARGSGTYLMQGFEFKTDADKFAKQIGNTCPKK